MPILADIATSVLLPLLRLPLAAAALPRTGTTHNDTQLKQRIAGLLHELQARDGFPQRPHAHRAPYTYHSQRSSLAEENYQARSGKALDNLGHQWQWWIYFMPLEGPRSHPRWNLRKQRQWWKSSAPPILED